MIAQEHLKATLPSVMRRLEICRNLPGRWCLLYCILLCCVTFIASGFQHCKCLRLSFIPNTSELAFLGLAKQAQDHLDGQKAEIFKALKSNNGSAPKLSDAQLQELLTAKVRTEKVVHKDAKIRTFIQEDAWLWMCMDQPHTI